MNKVILNRMKGESFNGQVEKGEYGYIAKIMV